jgi:predicted extracellular nuclease
MRSRTALRLGASLFGLVAMAVGCSDGATRIGLIRQEIDADAALVIRQVYGGGSNSGAPLSHDFIELFNRSSVPVSLAGLSLQYASATGTGNFGATATQLTPLPDVTLAPGQSFLVQQAGGSAGAPLPAPDFVDDTPIALSATAGKVALVRQTTTLGCNGGSAPCSSEAEARILDLVGYGSANYAEGSAAPAASNATAILRALDGCADTNDNAADFTAAAPAPRNSASGAIVCDGAAGGTGGTGSGGAAGSGGTSGAAGGGEGGTSAGIGGSSNEPGPVRIHDIQGSAHLSPLAGSTVENVPGVVTAVTSSGFYYEDPAPDADPATSEALFVFTSGAPGVSPGDSVLVTGRVTEFRPGCSGCDASSSAFANLTTTEIERPTRIVTLATGAPLPGPTRIGAGGRVPPSQAIDDDGAGNVESASATFDAETDGIDFYESLEGMRVALERPVAVGPTNRFGELPVLADSGAGASLRTARGGIVIRPGDFNPERMLLDSDATPLLEVGDVLDGTVIANVDYSFANFKLVVSQPFPPVASANLTREVAALPALEARDLTIASFNVENLDPGDPDAKFASLGALIVQNLGAPDLVTLEEVQDNSGPSNDGVVTADQTLAKLAQAIAAAGGPSYAFGSIDPVDGADGGEPGGNIRVAFLFRTDRGLAFVERPGASATTANQVSGSGANTSLLYSPGRLDPTNAAFQNSRKPLAGEFLFNGQRVFVIANHWNSKGGDQPLFGRFQPPLLTSEAQRRAQAEVVRSFVDALRSANPGANVVALGDLNDFQFSEPVSILKAAGLSTLAETLPEAERYTYVFEGNSQVLDHVMVSESLLAALVGFDVVHVNAEFSDPVSDHDPLVARFRLGSEPNAALIPVLECVERRGPLDYVAHFGYDNPNALPVARPIGARNRFVPNPADRGQPTLFSPGRNRDVFQTTFRALLPWTLDGRVAAASVLSPRCR